MKWANAIVNENTRKRVVKISGEMKTPEETVMKNSQGKESWWNEQMQSAMSGAMKTPEETAMKIAKGFS